MHKKVATKKQVRQAREMLQRSMYRKPTNREIKNVLSSFGLKVGKTKHGRIRKIRK